MDRSLTIAAPRTSARDASPLARLPGLFLRGSLVAIGTLGALHAALTWPAAGTFDQLVVRLVDLDREMNLPTWFASMQWALLALILLSLGMHTRLSERPGREPLAWFAFAAAACFLSLDEVGVVHERLGTMLEAWLQTRHAAGSPAGRFLGFPSYYWILIYAPLALPAAIVTARFVWRHVGATRHWIVLGMFIFVYGAVGLDFIEGRYGVESHTEFLIQIGSRVVNFDIFLFEELMEMTGVALASYGFLGCLARRVSPARGDSPRHVD